MNESDKHWFKSVEIAVAAGRQITATTEELNCALGHIVQLLTDASLLLDAVDPKRG